MIQPAQTKKTLVKKTTQKKRLLNKLPANLPAYNYEAFSYKDMQRAVSYFQAELAKIEKLLSKLPTITNQQEVKTSQPVNPALANSALANSALANPYIDIYGGSQSAYTNQIRQQLPPQSKPEVVAPPLPYQPYQPGMLGDHMEMPSILGSSGIIVNTLKDVYDNKVETAKLPIVEDNSAELEADLKKMIG